MNARELVGRPKFCTAEPRVVYPTKT